MTRTSTSIRGFTMLELMMAMSIFSLLGLLVVVLMRQGITVFSQGTRDSVLQDRMDTVLPLVERRLRVLTIPATFDPPPPPPDEQAQMDGVEWTQPPPVLERLRSGIVVLRDIPDGPLKGLPCPYAAWVVDVAGRRSDPYLRKAGEDSGPDRQHIDPSATDDSVFLPSGGRMEVCFIAVAEDPDYPGMLTLYEGWRSPIGGAGTLLLEENLDTWEEVKKRCRPIATGLLHLGFTWRRVFSRDWVPTTGPVGETEGYVGWRWDSTRALDKKFPLYRGPFSLGDPSDDIFPAWCRLEIGLVAPTTLGLGRGETYLLENLGDDDLSIVVADITALVGPGPDERFVKVGTEWMSFRASRVDYTTGRVRVERGQRLTTAVSHSSDTDVYVGLDTRREVRLLYRDRFARSRAGGGR